MNSKLLNLTSLLFMGLILLTSCRSTTLIQTEPPGATVYVDGINVGKSPVSIGNSKIVTSCTDIRIEKEGYERMVTEICRDEEPAIGPIIGGFFFVFPWLWSFDYQPSHFYELTPIAGTNTSTGEKTKEQQLMELKSLYEKQLITEEEYTKAKEAIMKKYY